MPYLLRITDLGTGARTAWDALGVRSVLLLPLMVNGVVNQWLVIASSSTRGFGRNALRAYQTLSAQVALELENRRLMEQARQAGILGERQRLAHEIHDTLAQGFTSIVMNLEAAEGALPPGLPMLARHLGRARRTARESLTEARRLVWALQPEPLDGATLPEALARLAARWAEEAEVAADVTVTGTVRRLHPEVEVTLLRAAQEALANVRKHARAARVALTLSYMNDLTTLDVQDDGVGFEPRRLPAEPDASGSTGGFGLGAMRTRVEGLGGTLAIESAPGTGTTVAAAVPALVGATGQTEPAVATADENGPGRAHAGSRWPAALDRPNRRQEEAVDGRRP